MEEAEEAQKLAAITDGLQARIDNGTIPTRKKGFSYHEEDMLVFGGDDDGVRIAAVAYEEGGSVEEVVLTVDSAGTGGFMKELQDIQNGTFVPTIIVQMRDGGGISRGHATAHEHRFSGSRDGAAFTATRTQVLVYPDYTLKLLERIPQKVETLGAL